MTTTCFQGPPPSLRLRADVVVRDADPRRRHHEEGAVPARAQLVLNLVGLEAAERRRPPRQRQVRHVQGVALEDHLELITGGKGISKWQMTV